MYIATIEGARWRKLQRFRLVQELRALRGATKVQREVRTWWFLLNLQDTGGMKIADFVNFFLVLGNLHAEMFNAKEARTAWKIRGEVCIVLPPVS